ncbi:hypothetical protein ACFQQB_57525 [Nonomuraea rubra]|uniref:hypothetical protein n=1 Tax=Nonomuraea rubra TaxID=46180 RepID=UPI00361E9BB0
MRNVWDVWDVRGDVLNVLAGRLTVAGVRQAGMAARWAARRSRARSAGARASQVTPASRAA